MKILIAAKHPPGSFLPIGGVQTWSATIGDELERLGHQVTFWGPEWPIPGDTFDFGIFANLNRTKAALGKCGRVVKFSHGIIAEETGGPGFVATSEEVRDRWGCNKVIRQPLDLEFWTPGKQKRKLLTRHSYRGGLNFLPGMAAGLGLEFIHMQRFPPAAVRDTLQRSAVVFATGRAACEAMACGAAVVICDDRPYQGPLWDPDPVDAMLRNYSGRGGKPPAIEELKSAAMAAMAAPTHREHAERFHDVRVIAQEILCSHS